MGNIISFQLSEEDKTQLNQHIEGITAILGPKLQTLVPEKKKRLAKNGR